MQVALWVIAFTVIYAIITSVALIANSEHKGPKIPNALGLPIMIVLYFVALPTVLKVARGNGIATYGGQYTNDSPRGTPNLSSSAENENKWGSKYGNENVRRAVRDEMISNGSDPNMADAYTKLKYDEERSRNQSK